MVVDADQLSEGCKQSGAKCAAGRSFGLFVDAKNYLTDRTEDGDFCCGSTRGVRPVVMHGNVTSADAMWVNNFIDRSGQAMKSTIAGLESEIKELSEKLKSAGWEKVSELTAKLVEKQAEIAKLKERRHYLTVWSLVGDNLVPKLYPIGRFTNDDPHNDYKIVISSSFREPGKLYATFHQCWPGATGCLSSVRVLRVNTLSEKTEIDRTFGGRNSLDDNPSQLFHYVIPELRQTNLATWFSFILVTPLTSRSVRRSDLAAGFTPNRIFALAVCSKPRKRIIKTSQTPLGLRSIRPTTKVSG